jgi:phytoene/squalene synthetase
MRNQVIVGETVDLHGAVRSIAGDHQDAAQQFRADPQRSQLACCAAARLLSHLNGIIRLDRGMNVHFTVAMFAARALIVLGRLQRGYGHEAFT